MLMSSPARSAPHFSTIMHADRDESCNAVSVRVDRPQQQQVTCGLQISNQR